ncbi:MAG: HEAT repeat domain-containing protein, partial [Planctomycetota bacterium]
MVLMLDATAKKLLQIIEAGHPKDLRCAAVRVLGEIGAREPGVTQALRDLLQDPEQEVRLYALEAVGKLRIEHLLSELLTRVSAGGPEAEVAAEAAAPRSNASGRPRPAPAHSGRPRRRRHVQRGCGGRGSASGHRPRRGRCRGPIANRRSARHDCGRTPVAGRSCPGVTASQGESTPAGNFGGRPDAVAGRPGRSARRRNLLGAD